MERLGEGAFGKVYKARHKRSEDGFLYEILAFECFRSLGASSGEADQVGRQELGLGQEVHRVGGPAAAAASLHRAVEGALEEFPRWELVACFRCNFQARTGRYYIFEYVDSDLFRLVRPMLDFEIDTGSCLSSILSS